MTQFGPPQAPRDKPPKPRSNRRAPAGKGGKGPGPQATSAVPRNRTAAAASAAPGGNALQQLAARVQQQGDGPAGRRSHGASRHSPAKSQLQQQQYLTEAEAEEENVVLPAFPGGRVPRRDMLSSLAELLGASQLAAYQKAGWDLAEAAQQKVQQRQQRLSEEEPAAYSPPPAAEPPRTDFSRRNMARLGGEGVASIFGGSPPTGPAGTASAAHTAKHAGGGFMSALHDLKPGLSEGQRERQAAQREQLKRDLEEQMRQKKEAEAQRKAALAAQEEQEEAQLRAYWAAQARATQGEHGAPAAARAPAAPGHAAHKGNSTRQQHHSEAATRGAGRKAAAQPAPASAAAHSPPGEARRGEALVQPGITVFLPPNKEAERRGALRARLASQSYSEEAEAEPTRAVHSAHSRHKPPTPAGVPANLQALLEQVAAQSLLAAQQQQAQAQALPLLAPAQAAAWLAAANPALAAAAAAAASPPGLPALYSLASQLLAASAAAPPSTASATSAAPPACAPAGSDPQVLALLRGLAEAQQCMREQFAAQLDAVSRLSGDVGAARSERDRARQDLERVQRLLLERQQGPAGSSLGMDGGADDLDMLSVTTHVLPLGVGIPSRLGTPAGRGVPPPGQRDTRGALAVLPARHQQQTAEPWQAQQRAGGRAVSKQGGRTGATAGGGRLEQAAAGVASKGSRSAGASKALPAEPRGTWKK